MDVGLTGWGMPFQFPCLVVADKKDLHANTGIGIFSNAERNAEHGG